MIHIVAIDDHPVLLDGLKTVISRQEDMRLVGSADHGSKLVDLVREHQPEIAIMDLGMSTGGFDPVASIRVIKKEFPKTKVLVLTNYDDRVWVHALVDVGVSGYMLKSDVFSREIPHAIRDMMQGDPYFSPQITPLLDKKEDKISLTKREITVLTLVDQGTSNQMIALRLGLSEKRIRNLLVIVFKKLGIKRSSGLTQRAAAVNKARELGLLPGRTWDANLVECYAHGP